ncbi:hypothetical protein ACF08N_35790 [Streptomyces sp. NPDC015127]|uniref:hypothetical protein n=1 Tax=Streptomyces sp. NPDC015127 TaxID=3364939 RepID=UPI0036F9883C
MKSAPIRFCNPLYSLFRMSPGPARTGPNFATRAAITDAEGPDPTPRHPAEMLMIESWVINNGSDAPASSEALGGGAY